MQRQHRVAAGDQHEVQLAGAALQQVLQRPAVGLAQRPVAVQDEDHGPLGPGAAVGQQPGVSEPGLDPGPPGARPRAGVVHRHPDDGTGRPAGGDPGGDQRGLPGAGRRADQGQQAQRPLVQPAEQPGPDHPTVVRDRGSAGGGDHGLPRRGARRGRGSTGGADVQTHQPSARCASTQAGQAGVAITRTGWGGRRGSRARWAVCAGYGPGVGWLLPGHRDPEPFVRVDEVVVVVVAEVDLHPVDPAGEAARRWPCSRR